MKKTLILLVITLLIISGLFQTWQVLWMNPTASLFTYIFTETLYLAFIFGLYQMWTKHLQNNPNRKIQKLLQKKDLPLDVRNAIHSFENGTKTLDDAIALSPYDIYTSEIYNLLKEQNFSFVKNESKQYFIENYQDDFLASLKKIRSNKISSEDAIEAWSYELLTPDQTKEILQKNGENYPKTIQALSNPEFLEYHPYEEIMCIFQTEKKKQVR